MRDEIEPSVARHHQRWGGNLQSFHNTIDSMIWFVDERTQYVYQNAIAEFGLNKTTEIVLNVQPEGAGKIVINTITPQVLPWRGVYFDGVPVVLKVLPENGFELDHWTPNKLMQQSTLDSFAINLSVNDTFTAVFKKKETISGIGNHKNADKSSYQLFNLADEWNLKLNSDENFTATVYDVLGKKCVSANGERNIHLSKSALAKGVYIIEATNGKQKFVMRVVKEN